MESNGITCGLKRIGVVVLGMQRYHRQVMRRETSIDKSRFGELNDLFTRNLFINNLVLTPGHTRGSRVIMSSCPGMRE
ncbi:hypothetical protein MPTK1_3g21500 [Marchantia polymorpha subsp. ruderalis]|uniref:Uncharacterized protein n=2 Tax=Marchantia polymorpha TaxID=3197 RepID=A0AAF6B392_MARPO|nr:hypothetical protein MARPO_0089s0066 [Marchantia polymorpha]BBN06476.1 hypothetical protein Mp_3g21500 [Marchantia polymorpha subsp. ruderalis]|eukprot:PTQ33443.1 hypothetical protein MARPO_0089s0066 [Marchantia polymorpha]